MHYIRYDVLYAYVLSRLQYWSGLVQHDEERLLKRLLNANDKGQAAARKKQAAELNKAEKRKAEVDTLFARMYEDWAAGRITEYNFSMLSGKYQSEQAELDEKIERLQSAIATESQNAADAEKWIALMKECVNPTELTAELLNINAQKSYGKLHVKQFPIAFLRCVFWTKPFLLFEGFAQACQTDTFPKIIKPLIGSHLVDYPDQLS